MEFREVQPTDHVITQLLSLSADWAAENSCWGYRPNTAEDLHGRRIFCAFQGSTVAGYLFGLTERTDRDTSIAPAGTPVFEVEELYVSPQYRSQGIGHRLFALLEASLTPEQAECIFLSTATKNHRAILHFYIDELDMDFWSARLFKKLWPAER